MPARIPPAGRPGASNLSGIAVAIIIVAGLYLGREVLIPVTVAMLLCFVLSPLVELLRRLWLGRIFSTLLAVILALSIIAGLGTAIGRQLAHLSAQLPQYQSTIENKIGRIRSATVEKVSSKIERLGHQFDGGSAAGTASQAPRSAGAVRQQRRPMPVVVTQPTPSALKIGETVVSPILSPLATAGIILMVTIFALLQKEDLRDRAIRLLGSGDLRRTTVAMDDAGRRLSRYFLTQLGINTSFGAITATGLYFIGLPNPLIWGILGALLRFVPYIGSWIAAVVAIALAAAVTPGWSLVIWTAALYVATELVIGQAVEPFVYGHSTGLSPLAVIVGAIFWTWIWGPIGLIISTPITLCLAVLGRHIERLEFFDVLLGDRPALSLVESFYQRILADDPDEVEAQAERYLQDRPLSSYYDEVVLKGLQLAASDVARGTLPTARVEGLRVSIKELVDDLNEYDDARSWAAGESDTADASSLGQQVQRTPSQVDPHDGRLERRGLSPGWHGAHPVLCIAGRGPLGEVAAAMLEQLLRKHGLGARVMSNEAVSRAHIDSLDAQGVAMVCISYLDIGGNPAHLRHLLLRLRRRLLQSHFLVGFWPTQDPILKDVQLRREVGADYYVSSLHEAVDACRAEAFGETTRPRPLVPVGQLENP